MSEVFQLSLFDAIVQTESLKPSITIEKILADVGYDLLGVFESMEIAENEIETAMGLYPDARYLIYGSFQTIRPMFEVPIKTYEIHCRELLRRVAFGEPLNPPTTGEVLAFLIQCAHIIPLHNKPAALVAKLFEREFPELVFENIEMLSERYAGETDELYQDIVDRMKFKRPIPVERVPYKELLQYQQDNGLEEGWADEQNMLHIRASREANP